MMNKTYTVEIIKPHYTHAIILNVKCDSKVEGQRTQCVTNYKQMSKVLTVAKIN